MAVPDFQSIMLPLLRLAGDGVEHSVREAIELLADELELTDEERKQLLPSGRQRKFDNRVGWAGTHIKKAGLIESPRRGYFRITPRGREVLADNPPGINLAFLKQFPEFVEFRSRRRELAALPDERVSADKETPEELLEGAYQKMREDLVIEILITVKECSPAFFERLVVDVLVKMGYGGTRQDAGRAVGKSGDGGIDGIIKEDRLGLDIVYIQAKRWDAVVGRPEVQKFAGALQGHRARKGIFITTSSFSRDATEYASQIETKIVLMDGETLADLMIDHNVGVSAVASYDIKKIDSDYFTEA